MVSKLYRVTWAALGFILLVIFYTPSSVALDVTDDITVDTTWNIEDSPVIIRGNTTNKGKINVTASLTVAPGVNVKFAGPNSLTIRKELIAIGTVDQPITFEPFDANGQWVSIEFITEDATDAQKRVWTTFNNGVYESGSTLQYVVLQSGGGRDLAQASANGVLYMVDANPYLKNVTIRNGQSSAITVIELSNLLKIEGATIENNTQAGAVNGRAGGISVIGKAIPGPGGDLEITGSNISNNITESLEGGGGIVVGSVNSFLLSNNTISSNASTASRGGGVSLLGITNGAGSQSSYVISSNAITDNTALGNGGGIAANAFRFSVTNNRILRNVSTDGEGGGIYFGRNAQADVSENLIMDNTAEGAGGGVYVEQVDTLVYRFQKNIIAENSSTTSHGGGLDIGHDEGADIVSGKVIIDSNILVGNFAGQHSAAMNLTAVGSVTNNAILRNESRSIMLMSSPLVTAPLANDPVALTVSQNAYFYNKSRDSVISNGSKILPIVNNNNIVGNGAGYYLHSSLVVPDMVDPQTLTFDGRNNYYGVDEATVAFNVTELVDFTPIAAGILEDVPMSPPNNVTLQNNNGSVSLNWDDNPETDLQGYIVYWGTDQAPDYQAREAILSASATGHTIGGLDTNKTYYFAVTAIDTNYSDTADVSSTIVNEAQTNGNESWFSDELMVVGVGGTGTGGGGSGGGSLHYLLLLLAMYFIARTLFLQRGALMRANGNTGKL